MVLQRLRHSDIVRAFFEAQCSMVVANDCFRPLQLRLRWCHLWVTHLCLFKLPEVDSLAFYRAAKNIEWAETTTQAPPVLSLLRTGWLPNGKSCFHVIYRRKGDGWRTKSITQSHLEGAQNENNSLSSAKTFIVTRYLCNGSRVQEYNLYSCTLEPYEEFNNSGAMGFVVRVAKVTRLG